MRYCFYFFFFFSSRRRHTRCSRDWSSDVCSSDLYAPEAVAATCGIPAERIRALAAEIAETAFGEEIEIAVPWTDWAGRTQSSMRGRPVSIHAMRGISAHSNGFQTCRALHLLQMLLGT